jgi:group I intron endonuclease
MIGIYLITNKINNKRYVGKSININKRIGEHFREAGYERNINKPLYKDIKKYGRENFDVEVLEECNEEDLVDREQYYYEKLKPEYNIVSPNKNYYPDEVKEKIGKSSRERLLNNNPMDNRIIREKYLKVMQSREFREKMSSIVNDPNVKRKMIKNQPNRKPILMLNKETLEIEKEFVSIRRAVDWLRKNGYEKADRKSVSQCCKENHRYCYNHKWRYKDNGIERETKALI